MNIASYKRPPRALSKARCNQNAICLNITSSPPKTRKDYHAFPNLFETAPYIVATTAFLLPMTSVCLCKPSAAVGFSRIAVHQWLARKPHTIAMKLIVSLFSLLGSIYTVVHFPSSRPNLPPKGTFSSYLHHSTVEMKEQVERILRNIIDNIGLTSRRKDIYALVESLSDCPAKHIFLQSLHLSKSGRARSSGVTFAQYNHQRAPLTPTETQDRNCHCSRADSCQQRLTEHWDHYSRVMHQLHNKTIEKVS